MIDTSQKSGLAGWLVASFVLNALLIGLMIGIFIAAPKGRASGPPTGIQISEDALARSIVQATPEADQHHVRQTLRRAWREASAERLALAEAVKAVSDAMQAEPYDAEALETALTEWRRVDMVMRASLDGALSDVLAKLPAGQREELAQALVRRAAPRRPQRHDGQQRPPRERQQDPG